MPDPADHQPFDAAYRQGRLFAADVQASALISAPANRVWSILTDLDRYSQWNPFTPTVESDLQPGSAAVLHVRMPGRPPMVRTEWVNSMIPGQRLCWGMVMGHRWLLVANREQRVEPISDGSCRYVTVDRFSGLLTPLMLLLFRRPMQRGFQAAADGLKHAAEATAE